MSQFQVLFGRQMTVSTDLVLLKEFDSAPNTQAFTADLVSKLPLAHNIIPQNMHDSPQRSKVFYDRNTKTPYIYI